MFWKRKPDPLMDLLRNGEWKLTGYNTMASGNVELERNSILSGYIWRINLPLYEQLPNRYYRAANRTFSRLRKQQEGAKFSLIQSVIQGDWPYRLTLKDVDEELPNTCQFDDVWFFRDREQAMMAMKKWGAG